MCTHSLMSLWMRLPLYRLTLVWLFVLCSINKLQNDVILCNKLMNFELIDQIKHSSWKCFLNYVWVIEPSFSLFEIDHDLPSLVVLFNCGTSWLSSFVCGLFWFSMYFLLQCFVLFYIYVVSLSGFVKMSTTCSWVFWAYLC
jgi:hypothetical protein